MADEENSLSNAHTPATLVFSVPEHVLSRHAGGETVLMSLGNERYYSLDEIGTRLWALIGDGQSFGAIVAVLVEEYDVPTHVLEGDLTLLLNDLVANGLLTVDAR